MASNELARAQNQWESYAGVKKSIKHSNTLTSSIYQMQIENNFTNLKFNELNNDEK